jgi:hypothetical protein
MTKKIIACIVMIFLFISCDNSSESPTASSDSINITGIWDFTSTITDVKEACKEIGFNVGDQAKVTVKYTQNGNNLIMEPETPSGVTCTGTIDIKGNQFTIEIEYPCSSKEKSRKGIWRGSVSNDGRHMDGTYEEIEYVSIACSIKYSFTGTKR